MTVTTFYPPIPAMPYTRRGYTPSIFLAGTIDMGASVDWQRAFTTDLQTKGAHVVIFNPRRADWDSSWEQDISNEHFRKQVEWEMDHLLKARYVVMNFLPDSQSPVTLLELGFLAGQDDPPEVLVCCPPGFWRRGNVQIVCDRMCFDLYETMDALTSDLMERLS